MTTNRKEVASFLRSLNAGLREAIVSKDYEIRSQLGATLELLAELDAMALAELEWAEPEKPERHLHLVK